jgi:hypothetical protein
MALRLLNKLCFVLHVFHSDFEKVHPPSICE